MFTTIISDAQRIKYHRRKYCGTRNVNVPTPDADVSSGVTSILRPTGAQEFLWHVWDCLEKYKPIVV